MKNVRIYKVTGYVTGSETATVKVYWWQIPQRRISYLPAFSNVHIQMRGSGLFPNVPSPVWRQIRQNVDEGETLSKWHEEVHVRRISARLHVPRMTVWETLHNERLYPYHIREFKMNMRLKFFRWFNAYPPLHRQILFTDETHFIDDGVSDIRKIKLIHLWQSERNRRK
jgi:hypothetical protein